MSAMASQITGVLVVYSIVYSCADQRKHQSYASQAFVRGIHRWPVNSPHKGAVTWKMFPLDDAILRCNDMYFKVYKHERLLLTQCGLMPANGNLSLGINATKTNVCDILFAITISPYNNRSFKRVACKISPRRSRMCDWNSRHQFVWSHMIWGTMLLGPGRHAILLQSWFVQYQCRVPPFTSGHATLQCKMEWNGKLFHHHIVPIVVFFTMWWKGATPLSVSCSSHFWKFTESFSLYINMT